MQLKYITMHWKSSGIASHQSFIFTPFGDAHDSIIGELRVVEVWSARLQFIIKNPIQLSIKPHTLNCYSIKLLF